MQADGAPDGGVMAAASSPPPPTFTVAAVARRLGIAPPTLRTWDRRYGLGPTMHTAGAHRRYSPTDVERLMVMRRLTLEGVAPAEAARIAGATVLRGSSSGSQVGVVPSNGAGPPAPGALGPAPGHQRAPSGGGRVLAMSDGTPIRRGLARAAMSLDTVETERLLREAIRTGGVLPTWNDVIVPVLQALGERASLTGEGIDVEHALCEVLMGLFRDVTSALKTPRNTAPVLLACADRDYHSLPLHALAAALAEEGIGCRMLGQGLPPEAVSASVRRTGPAAIVLYARIDGADASAVQDLRRQRPMPAVVLAGPGWLAETVPPSVRIAGSLQDTLSEVLLAVAN
jgi:transposase-like protein